MNLNGSQASEDASSDPIGPCCLVRVFEVSAPCGPDSPGWYAVIGNLVYIGPRPSPVAVASVVTELIAQAGSTDALLDQLLAHVHFARATSRWAIPVLRRSGASEKTVRRRC